MSVGEGPVEVLFFASQNRLKHRKQLSPFVSEAEAYACLLASGAGNQRMCMAAFISHHTLVLVS